jgi:TusE/DsrC/DsvC family sulfur relay protein
MGMDNVLRGKIMNTTAEQLIKSHNTIQVGNKQLEVNSTGYLINFDDWNEDFAKIVAENEHLELSDCHWKAIYFLRDFYREYQVPPSPRVVTKAIGEKVKSWGCTNKDLERAFPLGGCKQACRLAGLPDHYCHSC